MSKSIRVTVKALNDHFGSKVLRFGSEIEEMVRIPLRDPIMFDFTSGGGVPLGRRTLEFVGPGQSGKTYIALKIIAEFQRYDFLNNIPGAFKKIIYKDKNGAPQIDKIIFAPHANKKEYKALGAAIVDYESTYDKEWGTELGVLNKGLLISVPKRPSEAIDITEYLLRDENISIVLFDSVGAVTADGVVEDPMEKQTMGAEARFWNKAMRKFRAAMNSNPNGIITLILINRQYNKVGAFAGSAIFGGAGINLDKSLSFKFELKGEVTKSIHGVEQVVGRNINIKNLKNKTHRALLEGNYYFSFIDDDEEGVRAHCTDLITQYIDLGKRFGIIKQRGALFVYDTLKVSGRETFDEKIRNTPKLLEALKADIEKRVYNNV